MTVDHNHEPMEPTHDEEELWNVFGGLSPEPTEPNTTAASNNLKTPEAPLMPGMNEQTAVLGSTAVGATYDAAPVAKPFPNIPLPHSAPERKSVLGTPGRKLLAVGTATVLAVGALTGIVVAEKHDPRPVAATEALPSTPTEASTTAPGDTTGESDPASFASNTLGTQVDPPGNIINSQFIRNLVGRSEPWADSTTYIPPLLKPNSFFGENHSTQNTLTNTTQEFLTSLSYLWSVAPGSKGYDDVLDQFTDEPTVREAVLEQNRILHGRYGTDNQFILFDTGDNPITPAEGGFNAAQLPTIVTATEGKLYLRVLKTDCHVDYTNDACTDDTSKQLAQFSDAIAFSSGDAAPIDISFAWWADEEQDGLAHLTVKSYTTKIDTSGNNDFFRAWFPIDIDSAKTTPNLTN
jgi:hypothetical protein